MVPLWGVPSQKGIAGLKVELFACRERQLGFLSMPAMAGLTVPERRAITASFVPGSQARFLAQPLDPNPAQTSDAAKLSIPK
jgi:hypothetical protein